MYDVMKCTMYNQNINGVYQRCISTIVVQDDLWNSAKNKPVISHISHLISHLSSLISHLSSLIAHRSSLTQPSLPHSLSLYRSIPLTPADLLDQNLHQSCLVVIRMTGPKASDDLSPFDCFEQDLEVSPGRPRFHRFSESFSYYRAQEASLSSVQIQ
eukprot:766518-Hanusia_phi.AAC.14